MQIPTGRSYQKFVPICVFLLSLAGFSGCVSSRDALQMETKVNCSIMKNIQDVDDDLFQIEDGAGAVWEAAICPT